MGTTSLGIDGKERGDTSAQRVVPGPSVDPWFIGVAYSAVENGSLYSLEFILERKHRFLKGREARYAGAFDDFERVRAAWSVLEAEHGYGAMLNLDSPNVKPGLAADAAFPEDPEAVANALKLRAAKGPEWFRSAYEIATYAPGVPLPPGNPQRDVLRSDPQF